MSLMGTLAKVAIGVAVAKGIGGLMKQGGSVSRGGGSTGGGSIFGGANSPRGGGNLGDVMGDILSGGNSSSRTTSRGGTSGGLGGLLEDLAGARTGGATTGSAGGGLNDILGGLTKSLGGGASTGGGGMGGGLGDLLGGLLGGAVGGAAGSAMGGGGSFGDVLNSAFGNKGEPEVAPTPHQEAAAGLMLRAMIQAAKSDGKIDAAEKDKLMKNLTDATPEEMNFVKQELGAPIDVDGLVKQIPQGLEAQVYAMSLLAIDLDNQNEAQYLHAFATGMGLDRQTVNAIHEKVGVQPLYS